MDDPNITMEEYIDSKKKKLEDKAEHLIGKLPAIVFNDIFDVTFSRKPTVSPLDNNEINFNISFDESDDENYIIVFDENSFSCKMVSVDNLKTDSKNENDKVNTPSSPSPEPTIGYFDDLDFFEGFENEFPAIIYNDLKSKSDPLNEPFVSSQHIDKFETSLLMDMTRALNTVTSRDSSRYRIGRLTRMSNTEMGLDVADTLCFQLGKARRRMTWRQFILALGLHSEKEMTKLGFGSYWSGSKRVIPDKVDLRDYWIEISISSRGQGRKKGTGVDLFYLRTIDRETANILYLLAHYLFHHAEGRKNGVRLFRGYYIGRLAAHFVLLGDQGLRGLSVVVSELPVIDLHGLGRLNIYVRFGDVRAWVSLRQENKDAPAADEGA
uniref:Uncharacterized protein n=1 Tax=Tanacetum cinerariifolium TaxID=118510 RepID=A0A6L2MDY1_TANCI|nr:hypothetical protein [Tanacetum cinerariifolium]